MGRDVFVLVLYCLNEYGENVNMILISSNRNLIRFVYRNMQGTITCIFIHVIINLQSIDEKVKNNLTHECI